MKNRNSWLLKILRRKICQWSKLNWESTVSKSNDNVNKFFSTLYNKLNRTVNKHMLSCVLQMRSHLCFVRAGKSEEQFPKDTVGQSSAKSLLKCRWTISQQLVTCQQCVSKSCAEMITNCYLVINDKMGKINCKEIVWLLPNLLALACKTCSYWFDFICQPYWKFFLFPNPRNKILMSCLQNPVNNLFCFVFFI